MQQAAILKELAMSTRGNFNPKVIPLGYCLEAYKVVILVEEQGAPWKVRRGLLQKVTPLLTRHARKGPCLQGDIRESRGGLNKAPRQGRAQSI